MQIEDFNDELGIERDENRPLLIPKVLRQYILLKKIFEGPNSVVFETHDNSNGRKLAVKCISMKNYLNNPNEFDIMYNLNHPNVIKAIEFFPYPDNEPRFVVIIMPMATTDLFEYMYFSKFLRESVACKIIKQLLEAVAYLHSRNIWHRDLKLDNIFVLAETRKGPSIAVGDFGMSIETEEQFIRGPGLGSPLYSPPELIYVTGKHLYYKANAICMFNNTNQSILLFKIINFMVLNKI